MARNVSGWIPGIIGWIRLKINGVAQNVQPRANVNLVGNGVTIAVADDSATETTTITLTGAAGSVPTGTGIPHIVSGVQDAAASLIVNADVHASAAIALSKIVNPTGTGLVKTSGGAIASAGALLVNADVDAAAAVAYSKLGTGTQTHGVQTFQSTVDTKGTVYDKQPVNVQTTDGTVTTLDSFTLASNTAVAVTALIVATKSDMTQAAAYSVSACFRNNAGTVAQVGTTTTTVLGEDDSAWTATIDNSTTTIRVRVTGNASDTVRWTCVYTRLEVIP